MTQDNSVLSKISAKMPHFSKSHKKIGNYIMQNYVNASYMTAVSLGSAVGTSESTVVRFACEIGYAGYPELQEALKGFVKNKLTSVQRIKVADERIGDSGIFAASLQADIENVRHTLAATDIHNFEEIVSMLINAKRIYIIGTRSSAALASFMNFYFTLMFTDVRLVNTSSGSEVFEQMINVGKGDAVVGISFPRYSRRTVDAMTFAKKSNASVIAITDCTQSPIAAVADRVLFANNDMASFVDSLVAPLSVINALICAVGQQKKDEISAIFEKLEDIWDEYDVYEKSK